jgi:hypothetical protein
MALRNWNEGRREIRRLPVWLGPLSAPILVHKALTCRFALIWAKKDNKKFLVYYFYTNLLTIYKTGLMRRRLKTSVWYGMYGVRAVEKNVSQDFSQSERAVGISL